MTRLLWKFALCSALTALASPPDAFAGRGGGMQRGGGYGGGGGGYSRGGGGYNHSSTSGQQRPPTDGSGSYNRNSSQNKPGAGYSNRNQADQHPGATGAAAGAGYANKNQADQHPGATGAAAGASYSNKNQSDQHPNATGAAAGAGYANHNQSGQYPNAGAAAAGAGYANHNQNPYSNAGAAAAGAGYANRNQYDQYHPGMSAGYWNGNYGAGGLGAYSGMGMASPSYGYGSSAYMNPYAVGGGTGGASGGGQAQPANAPANDAPAANPAPTDYSQPLNTAAAPPDVPPPADPEATPVAQARQAFQAGDYATALQLTQQAIGQMPNDLTLHEFLALILFAQGNYEQAAAPLYAVLAAGPGWDWTTLIGYYSDAGAYTTQLRGLQDFAKANPKSAKAQFVLAYHYISEGHVKAAAGVLKDVVALQPDDTVSARLLDKLQPPGVAASSAPGPSLDPGILPGVWVAQAPPNATITLTVTDNARFNWAFAPQGKAPVTISGTYTLDGGVLTLASKDAPGGSLAGQVASTDDHHLSFKAVGGPSSDPGLQFGR